MNKIYISKCDKKNSHELLFNLLHIHYEIVATENDLAGTKHGKLYLKNSPIFFNITHSNEIVAIAIGESELGLDVEFIKPRTNSKLKDIFGNTPKTDEDFYTLWTKAESFVKYSASSIVAELKKITLDNDSVYYNGEIQPVKTKSFLVDNYVFSICSTDLECEFIKIDDFII